MHLNHAVLLAGLCFGTPHDVKLPRVQQPTTAAPVSAQTSPAEASAPQTPAAPASSALPASAPNSVAGGGSPEAVAPHPEQKSSKHKSKKDEYTGPNTIVELAPTPMLDEEGKQRLDPDGKPMFNAAIKQQRDKYGHPLFEENGKPVMQTATDLGFDEHGKKLHAEKTKAPKMVPVNVSRGILSVDGMAARAALNYDIPDFKYLYIFAPGVGTVVVSNEPFPGATAQQKGFDDKVLTVMVGEHVLQLASDQRLLAKEPKVAYVLVDREFVLPSRSPVMGYGPVRKSPYVWPGAKPNAAIAGVDVPPVPESMLPTLLLKPCPAGQMRKPAPRVLPGQTAPDQPCIPIVTVKTGAASANPSATATARP
jgi:hypothetical protein